MIDAWDIVTLYSAASKKESWIEAISLGYTMLESQLVYLAQSGAGPTGNPLTEKQIESCRYLIELAALCRDEGFLPAPVYDAIDAFNTTRRRAIHKLRTGSVTRNELKAAAESVDGLYASIQGLWLKVTLS